MRPTCGNNIFKSDLDKILTLPSVIKRMNDLHLREAGDVDWLEEMLKTIQIPKNYNFLSETLPPANYEPLKLIQIEKGRFLKTLHERTSRDNKIDIFKKEEIGKSASPTINVKNRISDQGGLNLLPKINKAKSSALVSNEKEKYLKEKLTMNMNSPEIKQNYNTSTKGERSVLSKAEKILANDPRVKRTKIQQSYSIGNVNKILGNSANIVNLSTIDKSVKENTPYEDNHLFKKVIKKKEHRSLSPLNIN